MMSELKDDLSYNMSFQGDFNFGNIKLMQFSTAHQFSKKSGRNLIRLLFNYDYIKESDEIIASDFTGQLRYNYSMGENSVFCFCSRTKYQIYQNETPLYKWRRLPSPSVFKRRFIFRFERWIVF